MTKGEVEAKFRALESGQAAPLPGEPPGEVDQELAALKKRVRIQS
jgi:hypothetical protein